MNTSIAITPESLGSWLIDEVERTDRRCSTLQEGIEHGLCNVKLQFADEALAKTGCKLTEELLISWLLATRLEASGCSVIREHQYPGTREECDLVITLSTDTRVWVEVKHAWKSWFNCDCTTGASSAYKGYLFGDASHKGAAHDFDKLETVASPHAQWIGVLLIGWDSNSRPMYGDVQELVRQKELVKRGWSLAASRRWADRRNPAFGIATWFWMRKQGANQTALH